MRTTQYHLHIIKRNGTWYVKPASDLLVGDIYEKIDGSEVAIQSINVTNYNDVNDFVPIRKLNVELDDVYYANGILTHNIK